MVSVSLVDLRFYLMVEFKHCLLDVSSEQKAHFALKIATWQV